MITYGAFVGWMVAVAVISFCAGILIGAYYVLVDLEMIEDKD